MQVVNWSRHRNEKLWGADANTFNPKRDFLPGEVARVGRPCAAQTPQSDRFSPFAHNPRSCLGKNFAQLEMRLILSHLLKDFTFTLAPPYDKLESDLSSSAVPDLKDFRGVDRATMGPRDMERSSHHSWGERPVYAMKLNVIART